MRQYPYPSGLFELEISKMGSLQIVSSDQHWLPMRFYPPCTIDETMIGHVIQNMRQ